MSRQFTNRILDMVDDGVLDKEFLIQNLLMWMSESEVKEFYDSTISDELENDDEE